MSNQLHLFIGRKLLWWFGRMMSPNLCICNGHNGASGYRPLTPKSGLQSSADLMALWPVNNVRNLICGNIQYCNWSCLLLGAFYCSFYFCRYFISFFVITYEWLPMWAISPPLKGAGEIQGAVVSLSSRGALESGNGDKKVLKINSWLKYFLTRLCYASFFDGRFDFWWNLIFVVYWINEITLPNTWKNTFSQTVF